MASGKEVAGKIPKGKVCWSWSQKGKGFNSSLWSFMLKHTNELNPKGSLPSIFNHILKSLSLSVG